MIVVHSILPVSCIAEVKIENLEIIFKAQPKTRKSFFHFLTVSVRRREKRGGEKEDQQIFVAFIFHIGLERVLGFDGLSKGDQWSCNNV